MTRSRNRLLIDLIYRHVLNVGEAEVEPVSVEDRSTDLVYTNISQTSQVYLQLNQLLFTAFRRRWKLKR